MRLLSLMISMWAYSSVHFVNGFHKFGCDFQSNEYEFHVESPESPIWGAEADVMQFTSTETFETFLDIIKEANDEVLRDLTYNNLDELNEFFDAYTHHGNVSGTKDFDEFYQDYHPQYDDCHGSPWLAIELFERAVKEEPKLADHYHLISCGAGIPRDMLYRLLRRQSVEVSKTEGYMELWPFPYHNHVAGFIKISIESRKGYVLVDPGFGLEHPIVIMLDGEDPHFVSSNGTGRNSIGQTFSYELDENGSPYIVAHTKLLKGTPPKSQTHSQQDHETHFYYFGHPYCSFLDSTVKPNLVDPTRALEKRSAQGKLEAQVELILFDSSGDVPQPEDTDIGVRVVFTLYRNGKPTKTGSIQCTQTCAIDEDERNSAIFKQVGAALHMPTLRDKINDLVRAVNPDLRLALYNKLQFLTALPADDLVKIRQHYTTYEPMDRERRRGKLLAGIFRCYSGTC